MKTVRYLAEIAWNPKSSRQHRGRASFDQDIATDFFDTMLYAQNYDLFNDALDWIKDRVGPWLFDLVVDRSNEETFDFAEIKDRYVL